MFMCICVNIHTCMYTYVVFLELPEFYDYSVYCAQHEQFSDRKLAGKKIVSGNFVRDIPLEYN